MPNWVHNTLRVMGSKKQLTQFAWAIGSPSAVINWEQLAELVPMTWDHRDERSSGKLKIQGRDLVYRFDTAWNFICFYLPAMQKLQAKFSFVGLPFWLDKIIVLKKGI